MSIVSSSIPVENGWYSPGDLHKAEGERGVAVDVTVEIEVRVRVAEDSQLGGHAHRVTQRDHDEEEQGVLVEHRVKVTIWHHPIKQFKYITTKF